MSSEQQEIIKISVLKKCRLWLGTQKSKFASLLVQVTRKLHSMDPKQRKKLIFIIISAGALLVALWVVVVFSMMKPHQQSNVHSSSPIVQQAVLMQKKIQANSDEKYSDALSKIEQQLGEIEQSANSNQDEAKNSQALRMLAGQLSILIQNQKNATAVSNEKMAVIEKNQLANEQQSSQVQHQLAAIHKAVAPVHYLSVNILPFRVEGLSFWNGQPMVTISMIGVAGQHFYKLIGVGNEYGCQSFNQRQQGCSSWIVKSINVNNSTVIFTNHRGQLVRVVL